MWLSFDYRSLEPQHPLPSIFFSLFDLINCPCISQTLPVTFPRQKSRRNSAVPDHWSGKGVCRRWVSNLDTVFAVQFQLKCSCCVTVTLHRRITLFIPFQIFKPADDSRPFKVAIVTRSTFFMSLLSYWLFWFASRPLYIEQKTEIDFG
jgi:hypothetical protein